MIKSIFYFVVALSAMLALAGPVLAAPTETVLYRFQGGTDGGFPDASLIEDSTGNLYTTSIGSRIACNEGGCGTVVRVSPPAAGQSTWTETTQFRFGGGTRGAGPYAALTADAAGNLYTTTAVGGHSGCDGGYGCGTIVKLSPPAAGKEVWTEHVLYRFQGGVDGDNPRAGLIMDGAGNLYTTAVYGGRPGCDFGLGCGTVVRLSPPAAGATAWKRTILYRFKGGKDGGNPYAGLIMDSSGNLYTTTYTGGGSGCQTRGCGTIVKLSPSVAGASIWTETVLYRFTGGTDGTGPDAGLIADKSGRLYTTALFGGNGFGTVVMLSPPAAGALKWTEKTIYGFRSRADGSGPKGDLIADKAGNLYGTTSYGVGSGCSGYGCGTIFRLSPPAQGKSTWAETILFEFNGGDGFYPNAGLFADKSGNLFTTTINGGGSIYGTIVELSGSGFVVGN